MGKFNMEHSGQMVEDDDQYADSVIEPMPESSFTFRPVSLTVMFSFLFVTSTLLNTLFLIIFLRKPSLRNISNRFIVSLTISNLVSSWVLLPLVVADVFLKDFADVVEKDVTPYLRVYYSTKALCTTFNVAADFSVAASVFSTMFIAFDRFFAITDPLHYHTLVTKCRSWMFIGLGWLIALVVATISWIIGDEGKWSVCDLSSEKFQDNNHYWSHLSFSVACFLICFALPLLVISWAYARIYAAAQKNSKRTRRTSLSNITIEVVESSKAVSSRSSSTRSTSSQIVSTIRRRISNASLFLYKEEARTAKISVGVVILFLFCWFPFYIAKIIYATLGPVTVPPYIFKIVLIFSLTNATISPYVYMYRSKRIQREVLRLFGFSAKAKRSDFKRRRSIYHQLSANLEKIPASPICLEGTFKLESSSYTQQEESSGKCAVAPVGQTAFKKSSFFLKLCHPEKWRRSLFLSSSCMMKSSLSSASSNSCCSTPYMSNISSSTQTLSNFLPVDGH